MTHAVYVGRRKENKGGGMRKLIVVFAPLAAAAVLAVPGALAIHGGSTEVTVGSPDTIFPQNKQNEPAVAVNPIARNIVAAGANDEIDLEACNAGDPKTCPFTLGVGVSGIYFSTNSGDTWVQPTNTGYTARTCLGPAPCAPSTPPTPAGPDNAGIGPIGTLPRYVDNGLVADGDPAVGFG